MTLADDLRRTALDHAAIAIAQALTGNGSTNPERLARAAVEVAVPFLLDGERVEQALAAREQPDGFSRQARPLPSVLWERADGDEDRHLELMEQHGWMELATIRADGDRDA